MHHTIYAKNGFLILIDDKDLGVSISTDPTIKTDINVDLMNKNNMETNVGRITLNNNNNDSTHDKNITMVSGGLGSTNGDGDSFNKANIDNFANFDAFTNTITSNEFDLFGNNEFSSTHIDGHNMTTTTITTTTEAKDRFLGSLSSSLHNDNFDKKFASFMTTNDIKKADNINANTTKSSTSSQQQTFGLKDEENFADFSNANAFNTIPNSCSNINNTTYTTVMNIQNNKSKSTKDCDKYGKNESNKIPSKFRDDYADSTDEFDAELQRVLSLSLVEQ